MTKKLLSVMASAAILATGASAFDIFDDGSFGNGLPYTFAQPAAGGGTRLTGTGTNYDNVTAANTVGNIGVTGTSTVVGAPAATFGDALLFPAFFVGNGWETTLRVVNTSTTNAVVAKVVLYAGDDSRELRDFNIYLSAGDVWTGTIKIDSDGNAKLISIDDSAPLPGGGMASENNPMKTDPIAVPAGYVAVIGCAMAVDPNNDLNVAGLGGKTIVNGDYDGDGNADLTNNTAATIAAGTAGYQVNDFKSATADKDHAGLRAAYNAMVADIRNLGTSVIFNKGVITSGAKDPNFRLSVPHTTPTNIPGDNVPDYFFGPVIPVLTGDVRITDTINGKDMILPAIQIPNVTDDSVDQALLYAEGEAAHIADRALTGVNNALGSIPNNAALTSEYDYITLVNDVRSSLTNNVWMMYGDSNSLVNNQIVFTSPFKRVLLFSDINPVAGTTPTLPGSNGNITGALLANVTPATGARGGVFMGVKSANNTITDFGYVSALALVYDESENQASASQFSPATTPAINLKYEVSATEGNPTPTDNLSYYLQQAQSQGGFEKGYVRLVFTVSGAANPVPGLATQMIATDAGGKVVTNWIVPAQN